MNYEELNKREKEVYDAGGNASLDILSSAINQVAQRYPNRDSMGIRDLNVVIATVKEKY